MTSRAFTVSNATGVQPADIPTTHSPLPSSHRTPQAIASAAPALAASRYHPEQSIGGSSRRTESARGPSDATPLKSSLVSSPMIPGGFVDASFDGEFLATRASPGSGIGAANRSDRHALALGVQSSPGTVRGSSHVEPASHASPLASQLEQLRNRCVMLSSCLEHTTSERDALAEMIRAVSAYRDTLLQDMFTLRSEKKELEDAVALLQRDGAALRGTIAENEQALSVLTGEKSARAECEKELTSARSLLRQVQTDNEALAETVHVLKSKLAECESSLTAATVNLERVHGERGDMEKSMLEARVIESQMERLVLEREAQLEQAEKNYVTLDEERKGLQRELSAAHQAARQLQASYEALHRSHAALQARWSEATTEIGNERQKREAAEQRIQALSQRAEDAQREREALAHSAAEATAERNRATTRFEDAKAACDALERKLDDATRSREALLASESELRTRLEYARQREAHDAEAIATLTSRLEESTALLSSLRESLDIENVEVTGLRNRQEVLQSENEDLTASTALLRSQLNNAESTVAALSEKLEATAACHAAEKTELEAEVRRLSLHLEEVQAVNTAACDFQRQANQLVQGSSLQRDFATEQLRATQGMLVNLQKKLADEMDARQAAEQRAAALVKEKNDVLEELAAVQRAAQDTAEMLTAAKDDRDSLAAEIRRSQQLWNSLIDEQAQMRAQLQRLMPPPRSATEASPGKGALVVKREPTDDTRTPDDEGRGGTA